MARMVILDIPDETYERLAVLSSFYRQEVNKTILDVLEALGEADRWLESLGENYKPVPVALSHFLRNFIIVSVCRVGLLDKIPQLFKVKGAFVLQDFEVDIDKDYFMFSYSELPSGKFAVDRFDLTMERGVKTLTALSTVEVQKVSRESLDKLREILQSLEPREFQNLEDYTINIEEDEMLFFIKIKCIASSVKDFPSIRQISRLLKRVFKKTGIEER